MKLIFFLSSDSSASGHSLCPSSADLYGRTQTFPKPTRPSEKSLYPQVYFFAENMIFSARSAIRRISCEQITDTGSSLFLPESLIPIINIPFSFKIIKNKQDSGRF